MTHYAAEVEYSTDGWLEKNKDPLNDNITQLLVQSTEACVRYLFANESSQRGHGSIAKKGLFRTVAQRHKEQLNSLMNQLNSTHPHFVRCIIPNHSKSPKNFENLLVLDQLRCNGVLEGIRIARTGYPNRMFFSEFRQRYEVLVTGLPEGYLEGAKACKLILKKVHLDEDLYKVGLTKVFFKSGVLAELEERREAMAREVITRFQSIARGYLQRQNVRKHYFKAQATAIIKHNFQLYLGVRKNPWWKLYVKMRPLLMVSQETGRNKAQDMAIKKLEQSVKDAENQMDNLKEDRKKLELELDTVRETLEREQQLALDQKEFLKRSQERESNLEEQLIGTLDDLDSLEIQCEELLIAKKKVDGQAESWRSELENAALLIRQIETDRTHLRATLCTLKEEFERCNLEQVATLKDHDKLSDELAELKCDLKESKQRIEDYERLLADFENVKERLNDSNSKVREAQDHFSKISADNKELREELDELYKASSDFETIVHNKEEELSRVKAQLKVEQIHRIEDQRKFKDLESQCSSLSIDLQRAEREMSGLKLNCAKFEREEQNTRKLLQDKKSLDVKEKEIKAILNRKVDDLNAQIEKHKTAALTEQSRLSREITIKDSSISKLQAEREKLSLLVTDLTGVKRENEKLASDLEKARKNVLQNAASRSEVATLKRKLEESDKASKSSLALVEDLRTRVTDAFAKSNKFRKDLEVALTEKAQLFQQVTKLKSFIDGDLASKERLIFEKNKISQELENTQQELSNVTFEYEKLTKELDKKGDHLRRMRTSFTDEAMSNRTKLNKEKTDLEVREKKLQQELESMKVEVESLNKHKRKMAQEIEDLKYDISLEKKACSLAESQKSALHEQLELVQSKSHNTKHEGIASLKRNAELESLRNELADKNAKLVSLQTLSKGNISDSKGLAIKLADAERRLKLYEAKSLSAIETMPMRKDRSGTRRFDDSHKVKSESPAIYRYLNAFDENKENELSVLDSIKSLNIRNKSVEEVEELLTKYESSKRDLMSVFEETATTLLNTKDALAAAELENSQLKSKMNLTHIDNEETETDIEGLNATISDLELRLDSEIAMNEDLAGSLRLYKSRAEDYYSKLESAETVVLKASRAESFARAQWKEVESALAASLTENKEQENKTIGLQSKIQLLEDQLEDTNIDMVHSQEAQKRLTRDIQDLKERRKQDAADMEASLTTMRERYKEEIRAISEELEKERQKVGSLQSETRHLQNDLDMLKVRNRTDTLDPSWSSFKNQLESKIQELTKSNEQAVMSYQDSQRRVGSLLSQVRTLRATMEEITANRDQLQEEKRVLERRLNEVSEHLEELAQTPGYQTIESDDEVYQLKSSVRQKTQDHAVALQTLRAIEDSKLNLQVQLQDERSRVKELTEEHKLLDKENKDLHLVVVDLEAQLLGLKNDDSKFLARKVSLLEKQLEEQGKKFAEDSRSLRSNDRSVKDLHLQLSQKEKHALKLEDEIGRNESKIKSLQKTVESLQGLETTHSLAARRAEREAREMKERALRMEKELEDWKSRYNSISSKRNSRVF